MEFNENCRGRSQRSANGQPATIDAQPLIDFYSGRQMAQPGVTAYRSQVIGTG